MAKTKTKTRTRARPLRKTDKRYRRYEREIARIGGEQIIAARDAIRAIIVPKIDPSGPSEDFSPIRFVPVFYDADQGRLSLFDMLTEQVKAQFLGRLSENKIKGKLQNVFQQIGGTVDADILKQIGRETMAINQGPSRKIIDRAINETTSSLTGNTTSFVDKVKARITSGVSANETNKSLSKGVQEMLTSNGDTVEGAKNKAKFIARNAVSRSLGALNEEKQTALGIELYTWETADDERVRPTHQDLDGKIFSWDGVTILNGEKYYPASDPDFNDGAPTTPGQPWNCRCVGRAYSPEMDLESTQKSPLGFL